MLAGSVVAFALAGCGQKAGAGSASETTAGASQTGSQTSAQSAAAQTGSEKKSDGGKLKVVTTIYPVTDLTGKVGGDLVDLDMLAPGGAEPHDWEPTAKDIIRIQEADVFVYNGSGMEGWVEDALKNISNPKLVVVEASKGLAINANEHQVEVVGESDHDHDHETAAPSESHSEGEHKDDHDHETAAPSESHSEGEHKDDHDHEGEHGHEHHHHDHDGLDPHVWLNPMLAQKEMAAIAEGLKQADPANAEAYAKNLETYKAQFEKLDQTYRTTLSAVSKKDIVVAHAAYGYLCDAYGLNEIAITGLSPNDEPSPETMANIVKVIKEKGIDTIFFETLASPKVAQTIADETGAKIAALNPIEGLTDEDVKAGKDYFSLMADNLAALETALK